jgi:aspartate racemase
MPLVGIMATSGTVQSGIYQERLAPHGLAYRFPEPEPQARIMGGIRLVKAGDLAAGQSILEQQAWALLDRGCSKVVMACTEIPVALADSNPALDSTLIDPTEALAGACAAWCIGAEAEAVA